LKKGETRKDGRMEEWKKEMAEEWNVGRMDFLDPIFHRSNIPSLDSFIGVLR
jgi:hypothetical protein